MQIGNTCKCFKNTDAVDLPQKSWSNRTWTLPRNCYFQNSLSDSNVQPGLRATGHPFSSVNLLDSLFLPTLKIMTKFRSWKWEISVFNAGNSIRGNKKRNVLRIFTYKWFLSLYTFLLYFAPWGPQFFFPYLCHLYSLAGALTEAFISWNIVWILLGSYLYEGKWPTFIMMLRFFLRLYIRPMHMFWKAATVQGWTLCTGVRPG